MSSNVEQLADAVKMRDLMEELQANDGWKELCKILQECVELRDRKLDDPLSSMDATLQQEYVKGARQAFRQVLAYPSQITADAKSTIEAITEDNDEENEDGEKEE